MLFMKDVLDPDCNHCIPDYSDFYVKLTDSKLHDHICQDYPSQPTLNVPGHRTVELLAIILLAYIKVWPPLHRDHWATIITLRKFRFPTVIEVDLVSITLNLEECSSPNNSGIQISLLETKPLNWKRKSIVSLTRIARGFSETNWPNHDTAPRVSLFFPWALAIVRTGILLYCVLTSPDELTRTRLLNSYSPAIEDGIVEYYDTNFENNFAHKTKYREPPSPEIEVVWNQIWKRKFVVFSMNRDLIGGIEVPLDCPARLGKATENLVHVDSDESRGYSVMLNNLIRQYTWRDDYNNHMGEWLEDEKNREIVDLNFSSRPSVGDRIHVDHCIETLRLQLMCNADLTPMLVFKDDTDALEDQAGFNVHHKCRYWDKGQSCRVATD